MTVRVTTIWTTRMTTRTLDPTGYLLDLHEGFPRESTTQVVVAALLVDCPFFPFWHKLPNLASTATHPLPSQSGHSKKKHISQAQIITAHFVWYTVIYSWENQYILILSVHGITRNHSFWLGSKGEGFPCGSIAKTPVRVAQMLLRSITELLKLQLLAAMPSKICMEQLPWPAPSSCGTLGVGAGFRKAC